MGGRSRGCFSLNEEGHAVFYGDVSLENNGGFSLVRHRFDPLNVEEFEKFFLRIRGDGKRYQFRVKSDLNERHNYVAYFQTTGEWQTVEIPFREMVPNFRGRRLELPNYPGERMAEIGLLIGNKKTERFKLEVGWIGCCGCCGCC